ncbi:MAG: hypothetical protein IJ452_03420 [Butyricicoccus sp.]|nr:hypothetical protein [Butyricicoccus sp.]MBQ8585318.1 hypothetical protein [Butyricicoccus sp.]
MLLWILVPLAGALLFYRLYQSGLMVLNCKSALTYIGKNRALSASFTGCNGYIKRVLRFRAPRTCTLTLVQQLTRGCMQAELYDAQKKLLLTLDERCGTGTLNTAANTRFTLVLRFHKADGSYELTID